MANNDTIEMLQSEINKLKWQILSYKSKTCLLSDERLRSIEMDLRREKFLSKIVELEKLFEEKCWQKFELEKWLSELNPNDYQNKQEMKEAIVRRLNGQ